MLLGTDFLEGFCVSIGYATKSFKMSLCPDITILFACVVKSPPVQRRVMTRATMTLLPYSLVALPVDFAELPPGREHVMEGLVEGYVSILTIVLLRFPFEPSRNM